MSEIHTDRDLDKQEMPRYFSSAEHGSGRRSCGTESRQKNFENLFSLKFSAQAISCFSRQTCPFERGSICIYWPCAGRYAEAKKELCD